MSDTPNPPTSDNVLTSDMLKELVPPSADLLHLADAQQVPTQITDKQAKKLRADAEAIITQRLAESGHKEQNPNYTDHTTMLVARLIVNSLPLTLLPAPVLGQMDLRPYLDAMNGKQIESTKVTKGGTALDQRPLTLDTTAYMNGETKRLETVFKDSGQPVTPFKPGELGVSPLPPVQAVDTATGAQSTAAPGSVVVGADGEFNIDATAANPGGQATFPVADMVRLVQSGIYDMEQLVNAEQQQQKTNPTGQFPVEMKRHTSRVESQQLSPLDAINYLGTMTKAEVTNMQLKLASAGYFDQQDNGGFYKEGDAYDPNTMTAWKQLLQDSIANKVPVTQQLGQRSKDYREESRQARLRQVSQFDPAYSRSIINDWAQSALGRNLNDIEASHVDAQLRAMVQRRAGFVAGADNTGIDGPLPNQQGYTQNDVQAALNSDRTFQLEQSKNHLGKLSFALGKL